MILFKFYGEHTSVNPKLVTEWLCNKHSIELEEGSVINSIEEDFIVNTLFADLVLVFNKNLTAVITIINYTLNNTKRKIEIKSYENNTLSTMS